MRFTLRDWFWLVLVLALLMIWLIDHRRLSGDIVRLKEEIGQLQVDVLHASSARMNDSMEAMIRGYMKSREGAGGTQATESPEENR
jgi:hypothetical protein